ncbi:MAG: TIM-barrel domain-containing protein [Acidobacteriaceae bacterium]
MRIRSSCSLIVVFCTIGLFAQPTRVTSLPNGIDIRGADVREQITALRDDVLRVRIVRGVGLPEDASWAVLPDARTSAVTVVPEMTSTSAGFHTGDLRVVVDRKTLRMTIFDRAGNVLSEDARQARFDGPAFRVYKTMPPDEHYFGLGDKMGPLDRRNQAFSLWNTDAYRFQESTDPIYKAIPFFMTFRAGRAMGVLFDNTWRSSFDFGKTEPEVYSFGAVDGPLNYYVVYGPSPRQVLASYAWLTGKPPLPPLWVLGFQQSRYTYYPQSKVLAIADRLRADHIPADAIYLDIDFQDKRFPFTVDCKKFPDFAGMLAQLKAESFHVVTITDLHIADAPQQKYLPYDSGMAAGQFLKNPDGSVYVGDVWPGPSVFPDFTRQQTRAWFGTLYRDFLEQGVSGFWDDMNEPSIFHTVSGTMPLDVVHRIDEPGFTKRTASHAEIHNVYGMENARATFEGLKKLNPDLRPMVLTRASYAGGQRYGATWTGDNSSTWNHLRLTTPMLKNLGLSGFGLSGADVGGFAGTASVELLTKWLEVAAFQPIDRDHTETGTGDQEPWVGGAEQEAIRRHFIEERYRLMPYLYQLADESSRTGLPMLRPLFLEFPNATADAHPIDVDPGAAAEFMLGPDLLIAPSPYPEAPDAYSIEFPSRDWYDYWTGVKVMAPAVPADTSLQVVSPPPLSIQMQPALATLPVYVRAGSILPMEPLVQSTSEIPDGPLTLRVYTGSSCGGDLYLDDGKSYAFEHGDSLRMHFGCKVTPDGLELSIGAHQGRYAAWWKQIRVEVLGWTPRQNKVLVKNHSPDPSIPLAMENLSPGVLVNVADDGKGIELELQ